MSEQFTHNSRLPMPADILPLNPKAIMLDGIETLELGKAVGFWTPREEQCQILVKNGTPLVPMGRVPEIFNQLAAYTLMHGHRESRLPYLTGGDEIRGRRVIASGEMTRIHVDVTAGKREYKAVGQLVSQLGELAYYGTITGVLLEKGETWDDTETEPDVQTRPTYGRKSTHHEKVAVDRSHELYQRVIDTDRIPQLAPKPGALSVDVSIVRDNLIRINEGHVLTITSDRLFVLNALLTSLGKDVTRQEVEDMGFAATANPMNDQARFSQAKRTLGRQLGAINGEPLLREWFGHQGRGHYGLSTAFNYSFSDQRKKSATTVELA